MSSAGPATSPIWRGSFGTSKEDFGSLDGLVAHLSTKAASQVSKVPSLSPTSLILDFDSTPNSLPTNYNIDLYFFPENKSYESDYYKFLDKMYRNNLAARAEVENGDIFLFTSLQLPYNCRRFKGRHYLWGVFVEKKVEQIDHLCQQDGICQDFGSSNSIADECLSDTGPTKASQHDAGSNYELSERSIDAPFLDIVKAFDAREESENTNFMLRPVVQVGPYEVEASLGQMLQKIFKRYGDIAQDCPTQSNSARALFLEALARGVEELLEVEFVGCQRHHLDCLLSTVTNAEEVGLEVSWLRERYNKLKTTYKGVKEYKNLNSDIDKREVVEGFGKKTLRSKEAGVMELESEMVTVKEQLAGLQEEGKVLENELSHRRRKVVRFLKKTSDH